MNCGQHDFLKGLLFVSQSLTFMSEIEIQNPHDTVSNNIRFNCNEFNGVVENTPEAPTKTITFICVVKISYRFEKVLHFATEILKGFSLFIVMEVSRSKKFIAGKASKQV